MPNTHLGFTGIRFLVIDGDAEVLRSVESCLQLNSALAVHSLERVLLSMDVLTNSHARVDCVICAQDLTPISGLEFLKNLRSGKYGDAPHLRGVKFIMLTAHREMALVQAAVELDVHGYIVKPFDQMTLTRGIHKALAHRVNLKPSSVYLSVDNSSANILPVWLTSH